MNESSSPCLGAAAFAASSAVTALKESESPALAFGCATAAAAAAGWPGAAAAEATGGAPRRAAAGAAEGAGAWKPSGGSPSKATWRWSWWAPSVKKPGGPDRPRRADLGRAQVAGHLRDLGRELARGRAAGVDDLAVDAGDVDAAPLEVVGDRAARGELRMAGLDHRQLDLVLLGELAQQPDHARVHRARGDVLLGVGVEHEVGVLEQRLRGGVAAAARAGRRVDDRGGSGRLRGGGLRRRDRRGLGGVVVALVVVASSRPARPRPCRPPRRAAARRGRRAGRWPRGGPSPPP